MSDFDDRSGIVACVTPWGRWWQTIDDVTVEVSVPDGCGAKEIQCSITPHSLSLAVRGRAVFKVSRHHCTLKEIVQQRAKDKLKCCCSKL